MIVDILSGIEQKVRQESPEAREKIETIQALKKLVMQIDFSVEVVPLKDRKRLVRILESLKGSVLDILEMEIVDAILKSCNSGSVHPVAQPNGINVKTQNN